MASYIRRFWLPLIPDNIKYIMKYEYSSKQVYDNIRGSKSSWKIFFGAIQKETK